MFLGQTDFVVEAVLCIVESPSVRQIKISPDIAKCPPWEQNHGLLRITVLVYAKAHGTLRGTGQNAQKL